MLRSRIERQARPGAHAANARETHGSRLHDPIDGMPAARKVGEELRALLDGARESVIVESPYLVPTRGLREGLRRAIARGVRVRILTNSLASTDNLWPQAGYVGDKDDLVKSGVELWEYVGPECLHSKNAVIDGETVIVGSYNLDPRSQRLNRELAGGRSREPRELRRRMVPPRACGAIDARGTVEQTSAPRTRAASVVAAGAHLRRSALRLTRVPGRRKEGVSGVDRTIPVNKADGRCAPQARAEAALPGGYERRPATPAAAASCRRHADPRCALPLFRHRRRDGHPTADHAPSARDDNTRVSCSTVPFERGLTQSFACREPREEICGRGRRHGTRRAHRPPHHARLRKGR